MDRTKVVDAGNFLDLEAAVTWLEWQTVDKFNQTRNCLTAAQMRNVDSFDTAWRLGKAEYFFQACQPFLWISVEDFRLSVRFQLTSLIE